MNDVLRIAHLKIALQRAFLGQAILIFTDRQHKNSSTSSLSSLKRDDVDDNDGEGGRVPGLGGT